MFSKHDRLKRRLDALRRKHARIEIDIQSTEFAMHQAAVDEGVYTAEHIDITRGGIGPHPMDGALAETMLAAYGFERFVKETDFHVIAEDAYGKLLDRQGPLWRVFTRVGERGDRWNPHYRAIRVVNSTPEPDGTYKEYILRVPPWVETPGEGLAWTFGLENAEDYHPDMMT